MWHMTQPTYNCRTVAIVRSSVTDQSTKEAVFWWIYWSSDCRSCWSVYYAYAPLSGIHPYSRIVKIRWASGSCSNHLHGVTFSYRLELGFVSGSGMLSLGTGTATLTPVLHISDMSWPIKSFFKLLKHFGLSQMASRNSLDTITNQQLFPQLKQTLSFQAQRFFAPLHLAWSAAFRTMVRSWSSCWSFLMSGWLGRSSKTCEMGATRVS